MSHRFAICRGTVGLFVALASCVSHGPVRFPWQPVSATRAGTPALREVSTVVARYGRCDVPRCCSKVLVRRVKRATQANLGFAAYSESNLLCGAGSAIVPAGASPRVPAGDAVFGGLVEHGRLVASLAQTPLTESELAQPLAFSPLVDYLLAWNAAAATGLEDLRAAVKEERWGVDTRPGTFFQQATTAYLHQPRNGAQPELWIEVEFEPVTPGLFTDLPDTDHDGYPEVFLQARPTLLSQTALERIRGDYTSRVLSAREVHRFFNQLASDWYPSLNTTMMSLHGGTTWPVKQSADPDVITAFAGRVFEDVTAVMLGKPQGVPLYNVFIVDGVPPPSASVPPVGQRNASVLPPCCNHVRFAVTSDPAPVGRRVAEELRQHGGLAAWTREVQPLHEALRQELTARPKDLKAMIGQDGFLFYRRSIEYVVGGSLTAQPKGKNPLPAIVAFKNYLQKLGVDFLLVPVPTKAEVFADKLPGLHELSARALPMLNPHGRQLLADLSREGVEVLDLLPLFLQARADGGHDREPLYQPQDTHWTDRGLELAAQAIAERIKRYPWARELLHSPIAYTTKPSRFKNAGDLVSRLAPTEQRRFRPASFTCHQVRAPDGTLYDDDPHSPIVLLGDSFTAVFQLTYCENAGVSAHIAKRIGHPLDLVMSYGGGPNVRKRLLTQGEQALATKRLLIWLFTARDFYDYWEDWETLPGERSK